MISGMVAHLWQSTLFAGAAWLVAQTLRTNRAQVRYWVWFTASVKFLIPFSLLVGLGSRLPHPVEESTIRTAWVAALQEYSQPFTFPVQVHVAATAGRTNQGYLGAAALALWACGFAAVVICWLLRWRRIHVLRRFARSVNTPTALELPVPIMSAPDLIEPGVFGVLRPVLLLPEGIAERLNQTQLDSILAHEFCHVRRRDNLTAAIHMAVQAIFWFHPLTWWIGAHLVDEREQACDEEVLRLGCKPNVYAESILIVCKSYLASPLACVSGVTGSNLKRRIEAIMRNRYTHELSYGRRILLAAAAVAAVAAPIAIGLVYAPPGRAQVDKVAPAASAGSRTSQENPSAGGSKASSSAQPAKRDYRFEVASIKPGDPSGLMTGPPPPSSPRRFSAQSASIVGLALKAFGIKQMSLIEWQPWMNSARFNVEATFPDGATHADLPIMIQHLLEDRFGLVFHREARRVAGYELVVANSGPKLAKSAGPPDTALTGGGIEFKNGVPQFTKDAGSGTLLTLTTGILRGRNETMKTLAERLANELGAPVGDATGMEGEYDYTLTFTPEARAVPGNVVMLGPPGAAAAQEQRKDEFLTNPMLRDALQLQLGLKLQPVKDVSVVVVVLDSARKEPTEN